MKVFTFYANRYQDASTSLALAENGLKHTVLVHNQEQADEFKKHGTAKGSLVVTDKPRGLTYQRNAALELMDTDEWAAFMCDDFVRVLSYPKDFILSKTMRMPVNLQNQNSFRIKKQSQFSLKQMFEFFPALIQTAESNGVHLVGFALHDNPLSLERKFTTRGLADGRFWLVKKSFYKFDEKVQLIDDVAWTCENMVRHRNVLVLNWCIPYFKRYSSGGFGSITSRLEQRKSECQYLVDKYSPLLRFGAKPGWPDGAHIVINGGQTNIETIRKRRGYL